ncbi:hypothetical protein M407DRAFT_139682 [Tulasnella calospora MUT 4182]|uniref:Uncharacterized protein n=1 Tax=Tulasnella calospora MUT 4182 TaxID=1051891 RepID=A0A0C3KFJ1_9AGAM|nr:hypothetical protein M407DRAFT_139682 [Tulasnella calospora MUT 4182]
MGLFRAALFLGGIGLVARALLVWLLGLLGFGVSGPIAGQYMSIRNYCGDVFVLVTNPVILLGGIAARTQAKFLGGTIPGGGWFAKSCDGGHCCQSSPNCQRCRASGCSTLFPHCNYDSCPHLIRSEYMVMACVCYSR